MPPTTTQIDNAVEAYFASLESFVPGSISQTWGTVQCGSTDGAGRLARLVDAGRRNAGLLCHCTDDQVKLLCVATTGRAYAAGDAGGTFKAINNDGESRRLTRKQIAQYLGLSLDQFKRRLSNARKAVAKAIDEQWTTR